MFEVNFLFHGNIELRGLATQDAEMYFTKFMCRHKCNVIIGHMTVHSLDLLDKMSVLWSTLFFKRVLCYQDYV